MRLQIFSLYDKKALAYVDVFHFPQVGQAIRHLEDLTKKHPAISQHTEDYDLYKLGEFDDISGQITALKAPQFIQTALSLKPILTNEKPELVSNNHRS